MAIKRPFQHWDRPAALRTVLTPVALVASLALVAPLAMAAPPTTGVVTYTNARPFMQGFGSAHPDRPDVSLSPLFRVYEWKIPSSPDLFVQVNNLEGKVIGEYIVGSAPIVGGPLPSSSPHKELAQSAPSLSPVTTGGAQCPCASQVVASGPGFEIIVVTGSSGDVITEYCVGNGCKYAKK